ncbi:unnamed protein product [Discosporangium mesarthrocarpum]
MQTTLQLFMGVDFSAVLEETWAETGIHAMVFFTTYHMIGVIIVFNLLSAIVIQLYSEALNDKSRSAQEQQYQDTCKLQEALMEYNQKNSVLRLWGKSFTEAAADLNISRPSRLLSGHNMRRALGIGSEAQTLNEEELKACQKYAGVDLVEALREKEEGEQNLQEFERSFYQQIKNAKKGVLKQAYDDGDIIYQRGDFHNLCYFVHEGTVRIESSERHAKRKEKGEMFGEEALLATGLPVASDAYAEGPVVCLAVDKHTFLELFHSVEDLGSIFLRLQRSGSLNKVDSWEMSNHHRNSASGYPIYSQTPSVPSRQASSFGGSLDGSSWHLQRSLSVPRQLAAALEESPAHAQPNYVNYPSSEQQLGLGHSGERAEGGMFARPPLPPASAEHSLRMVLPPRPGLTPGVSGIRGQAEGSQDSVEDKGRGRRRRAMTGDNLDMSEEEEEEEEEGTEPGSGTSGDRPSSPEAMPVPSAAPLGRRGRKELLRQAGSTRSWCTDVEDDDLVDSLGPAMPLQG